jgi:hypothetical protein
MYLRLLKPQPEINPEIIHKLRALLTLGNPSFTYVNLPTIVESELQKNNYVFIWIWQKVNSP